MKKKIIRILLPLCVICVLAVGSVLASRNMNFFQWGKKVATINETASNESIAKVNGVSIPKSKFDSYKAGLSNATVIPTDEEIVNKLVEQEVIMQEIKRLGYEVTEQEIIDFNNERFELLEQYPQAYQITKDYVDGLGITMEKYKEMSKEISRTALLTNKYKIDVQKEFEEKNTQVRKMSEYEKSIKFEDYFENKIAELCQNANIEIIK